MCETLEFVLSLLSNQLVSLGNIFWYLNIGELYSSRECRITRLSNRLTATSIHRLGDVSSEDSPQEADKVHGWVNAHQNGVFKKFSLCSLSMSDLIDICEFSKLLSKFCQFFPRRLHVLKNIFSRLFLQSSGSLILENARLIGLFVFSGVKLMHVQAFASILLRALLVAFLFPLCSQAPFTCIYV